MASRFVTRAGRTAPRYAEVWMSTSATPQVVVPVAVGPKRGQQLMIQQVQQQQRSITTATTLNRALMHTTTATRYFSDQVSSASSSSKGKRIPTEEEEDKAKKAAAKEEEIDDSDEEVVDDLEEEDDDDEVVAATPEEARIKELEEETQKFQEEAKTLKDQLLRSLAEADNTRRIAKRDVQDARNFAVKSFAKSLLDVSDNLRRALDAVPKEMRHDHDHEQNKILTQLYEGIEMTEVGLMKAFEANGLKKYGQPGDVFDPNIHEALYEYPDPKQEPGTVGQVMKVGFMLNDRVLRPAEVGVVKKE